MQSARVAHKAPRIIAQAIVDGMDYPWLDHAEIAGAGFINFFLKNDVIYDTLKQILQPVTLMVMHRFGRKTRSRSNTSVPTDGAAPRRPRPRCRLWQCPGQPPAGCRL